MQQLLISVLSDLNSTSAGITTSATIPIDGLPVAAILSSHLNVDRVGATSATLLTLGNRSVHELVCDELGQAMVRGRNGYTPLGRAGKNAVLALMAEESGKLGLILLDAKRAARQIAEIL